MTEAGFGQFEPRPAAPLVLSLGQRSQIRWGMGLIILTFGGYFAMRLAHANEYELFPLVGRLAFEGLLVLGAWWITTPLPGRLARVTRVAFGIYFGTVLLLVVQQFEGIDASLVPLWLLQIVAFIMGMACLGFYLAEVAAGLSAQAFAAQFRTLAVGVIPVEICLEAYGITTRIVMSIRSQTGSWPPDSAPISIANYWLRIPALAGAFILMFWGLPLLAAFIFRLRDRAAKLPGAGVSR